MAYKNIALELFYKRYPDPLCLFDDILFAYAARHEDFVSYVNDQGFRWKLNRHRGTE